MLNESIKNRITDLFDELVPISGKCDSLAGELIRATVRIVHRYYNDGDRINVDEGAETCNAPAIFIIMHTINNISSQVINLFNDHGLMNDESYEDQLNTLMNNICDYIDNNPALRNLETDDMFDKKYNFDLE